MTLRASAGAARTGIEPEETAEVLQALGSAARLRILAALVKPAIITEVRVPAERRTLGHAPAPLAARQTVQAHVDKLIEAGLVQPVEIERNGRSCRGYIARSDKVRAAKRDLRQIVDALEATRGTDSEGTYILSAAPPASGPHLVVVRGAEHVTTHALEELRASGRRWIVGRDHHADIVVHDDPYTSPLNAYLDHGEEGFVIRDAPTSANGTMVNGERLEAGTRIALRHGDVIGVGRTCMLFREK